MIYQLSWFHPQTLDAGEYLTREKSIVDELMARRRAEGCEVWLETLSDKLTAAVDAMRPAVDLPPEGLQTVIPGCEKDQERDPDQKNLW